MTGRLLARLQLAPRTKALAIVRVALPVAAHQLFDYWLPVGLAVQPGSILVARLGARRLTGVAIELAETSEVAPERLLPVEEVVTGLPPLPAELLDLGAFVAGYYQQAIGLAMAQMLPPLSGRRRPRAASEGRNRVSSSPGAAGASELNAAQRAALAQAIPRQPGFAATLLQGVTGSGKTAVYLEAAAQMIAAGRQVLLLVPEIALTPQLEQRIADQLPGIRAGVLHSGLSAAERRRHWIAAATGQTRLVVGTRLAVFTPLPDLGLIVVDEEHDSSFKQQEGVRYHARDVAIYRASRRGVPVVLGSATPSLESYAQAKRARYRWHKLPLRANARAVLPSVRLVPNRGAATRDGIGTELREAIADRLDRREQSLLFINRRGYAPALLCVGCGWTAQCPRCTTRLVFHREAACLRCHHCGHRAKLPRACPQCGNQDLLPQGSGTQRLERALADMFPAARTLRIDRDSTRRKGVFASMRDAIDAGDVDIMIGTQMLAKGHDFPHLTLVGVLGADNALYSSEFRATERLFALLEQVGGRAGRRSTPGEVLVQTDFPRHPLYAALVDHDFDRFADA
ncbi:MAG TPA: primosomal protein N', partial [Casimicrobiaceae bacterium]|nr:primosomal protein N' [Casimicrobiaceae bacterium]